MTRIVLVDDDEILRDVLAGNLADAGYDVQSFAEGAAALAALTEGTAKADLLVLDWKMPGLTGLDLLRRLRAAGIGTNALFFTSYNDTLYEEAALSCGAVDFIDKTRSFAVLRRRIEMILERARTPVPPEAGGGPLVQGALSLDAGAHRACWRDHPVALTFGEFRVVSLLATAGRDLSYRDIYDALKGENFAAGDGADGYRANVRALIKRIREKFTEIDPAFDAIVNYPGFGYRWVSGDAHA